MLKAEEDEENEAEEEETFEDENEEEEEGETVAMRGCVATGKGKREGRMKKRKGARDAPADENEEEGETYAFQTRPGRVLMPDIALRVSTMQPAQSASSW
jgi:hypothetical protein